MHGAGCVAHETFPSAMCDGQQLAAPPGRAPHAELGCAQTPHSFAQQTCSFASFTPRAHVGSGTGRANGHGLPSHLATTTASDALKPPPRIPVIIFWQPAAPTCHLFAQTQYQSKSGNADAYSTQQASAWPHRIVVCLLEELTLHLLASLVDLLCIPTQFTLQQRAQPRNLST